MKITFFIVAIILLASIAHGQTTPTFRMTWTDASTNETGFNVYHKKGTAYEKIGNVGAGVQAFEVAVATTPGSTVCFAVTAFNATGESQRSNDACATVPDVAPTTPVGLAVELIEKALEILKTVK